MKITKRGKSRLDQEIEDVLVILSGLKKSSVDYAATLEHLECLYKMKAMNAERCIKPDTILLVAANLAGILLILKYEKLDAITSKAIGFVSRGRV